MLVCLLCVRVEYGAPASAGNGMLVIFPLYAGAVDAGGGVACALVLGAGAVAASCAADGGSLAGGGAFTSGLAVGGLVAGAAGAAAGAGALPDGYVYAQVSGPKFDTPLSVCRIVSCRTGSYTSEYPT